MTTNFLFSGSDVSGRDELLGRVKATAAPRSAVKPSKPNAPVARTATVFAIALAVCFASSFTEVSLRSAESADVPIDMDVLDPTAARISNVTSSDVAPTTEARSHAYALLDALRAVGLEPSHVVADPDGGVSLYVFESGDPTQDRRYARLLATNERELIATFEDPSAKTRSVWPIRGARLSHDIDRVRSFVLGKA